MECPYIMFKTIFTELHCTLQNIAFNNYHVQCHANCLFILTEKYKNNTIAVAYTLWVMVKNIFSASPMTGDPGLP